MPNPHYDLAVAYRIYPGISKAPPICSHDKYNLAEVCLRSFKEALGSLKVKLWALMDDCPPEYGRLFTRYFDPEHLELISMTESGNAASFQAQIRCLVEQEVSSLVYFAEDDYYYLPGQFESMIQFLTMRPDVHFVSPYDHLDYYILGLHRHPARLAVGAQRHWRQVATTCLTFLTTRATLRETAPVFDTYARRNYDSSIWLSLTKYALLDPAVMFRTLTQDGPLWKAVAKAWLFGWRQICLGKRWNVWVPVPAIATHMECSGLAPSIDWQPLFKDTLAQIEDNRREKQE